MRLRGVNSGTSLFDVSRPSFEHNHLLDKARVVSFLCKLLGFLNTVQSEFVTGRGSGTSDAAQPESPGSLERTREQGKHHHLDTPCHATPLSGRWPHISRSKSIPFGMLGRSIETRHCKKRRDAPRIGRRHMEVEERQDLREEWGTRNRRGRKPPCESTRYYTVLYSIYSL